MWRRRKESEDEEEGEEEEEEDQEAQLSDPGSSPNPSRWFSKEERNRRRPVLRAGHSGAWDRLTFPSPISRYVFILYMTSTKLG